MIYALGGRPSKGTPADKRLKPNKPKGGKAAPFGGKRAPAFGTKKGGR